MKNTSRFIRFIQKSVQDLIDYVFPPQCPYCDGFIDRSQILCDTCFKKIQFITGTKCYLCGRPLPPTETDEKLLCPMCLNKRKIYDISRSVFIYDSFSRNAILKLKYADRTDLRHFFVNYMLMAGHDIIDKSDIIIPVPLHWRRRLKRKYNQAAVLAELLAQKSGKKYTAKTLVRRRYTHNQNNKSNEERKRNVKNAFDVVNPDTIRDLSVLLIDDVLTTGATAEACAKVLKQNGAKAVYVLTIAQVVHN